VRPQANRSKNSPSGFVISLFSVLASQLPSRLAAKLFHLSSSHPNAAEGAASSEAVLKGEARS